MKLKFSVLFILLFISIRSWAFEAFEIEDISINGLQRISLGTVFTYLPIKVGETMDNSQATNVIRLLFKTGFFEDVKLSNEDNILVISVVERPSIASVKIFGNREISTEDLNETLKGVNLVEGLIFNRSILDQMEQELRRQYLSLGKYGVNIDTSITEISRNRVELDIEIEEGEAAHIKNINIIGAKAFSKEKLLDKFELTVPRMFSGISGSESYSKQQLTADLETLKSYYLNRGYIKFNIESTQVSISPDKRDVFITINILEGGQYRVGSTELSGETIIPRAEILSLVQLKSKAVFSRRLMVNTRTKISQRLGIEGYAFANVNAVTNIDEEKKEISVVFYVDPGKRVYVRRINILGNTKTQDEVIRRELRQMEGGWISTPLIERSKVRLQRLGFFEDVKIETPAVPGTTDQVDVNFKVVEGSTGNFTAGLGYGETDGLLFNTSITLNNYLGTGKRVSMEANRSNARKVFSFSLNNPYFTEDGVSRGFRVFFRKTDSSKVNLADFTTDARGASMNFSIPMTEYTSTRLGVGYEDTTLKLESTAPESYEKWLLSVSNSTTIGEFGVYTLTGSFSFDTRNRAIFPDKGVLSQVSMELAIPGSDLEFYKASYRHKWYIGLTDHTSLLFGGEISRGGGYGDGDRLPIYENYYLGGNRSLRGFKGNTVGPYDKVNKESVGGEYKLTARAELFFPSPFTEEQSRNFKLSTFIDAGRLYGSGVGIVEDDRLRSSYGLSAVWITPVGALTFTFARPMKYDSFLDETEFFSFNIGAPF